MNFTFNHTTHKSGELDKLIRQLTKSQVMIGIPSETPDRKPDIDEVGTPLSNALIGYLMERGIPERNVPERPFLVPGVRDVKERIAQEMVKGIKELLRTHDPSVADRTLHIVGLIGQRGVQNKIQNGEFVPLAPSTIAKRLSRGRTGIKPLIDTGQLRNAITYVIRNHRYK